MKVYDELRFRADRLPCPLGDEPMDLIVNVYDQWSFADEIRDFGMEASSHAHLRFPPRADGFSLLQFNTAVFLPLVVFKLTGTRSRFLLSFGADGCTLSLAAR